MMDRPRSVRTGIGGWRPLAIAVALCSNTILVTGEPRQEFYAGRYQAKRMEHGQYLDIPIQPGVGSFEPALPANLAGITEQIVFECPPGTSLSSVGGYAQFSDYLRNALIAQLSAIDSYAEPAAVTLSGMLSRLEMYLDRTVAEPTLGGTWSIALELRSSLGAASVFSIEHTRPIGSGNAYCQAMVDGFMEAVQELLTTTLRSREFRALLDPESAS